MRILFFANFYFLQPRIRNIPSHDNTNLLSFLTFAAIRRLEFVEPRYRINTRLVTILTLRVIYNRSFYRRCSEDAATRGLNCRRSGIPMYNTAHVPDATCSPSGNKKRFCKEEETRVFASFSLFLFLSLEKEILRRHREPPVFYCRHVDFSAAHIKIINDVIKIYAAENLYLTGSGAFVIATGIRPVYFL